MIDDSWDVQISDKLRSLPLKTINALIKMFVCNKLPVGELGKDVVKSLTDLKLANVVGDDCVYVKNSLSHDDYFDLVDYRDTRLERQVRARMDYERKHPNG